MSRAPEPAPIERARALRIGLVCALVWAVHAASFWPFFTDDAFITLRYAQRWLEHGEITWNAGERVEGYSNPLWLVGCSALGALGIELVLAARVLGALCAAVTLAALLHAFPPRAGEPRLRAWIAPLSAALAGPIAAWTLAGLEEPLVLALLACALAPLLRLAREPRAPDAWRAGLPLALACLTRPDGALYTALACFALLALHEFGAGMRVAARLAALPLAATALLTLARLAYYGEWLPNTAYAKAAVDGESLRWGLEHYALPALAPLCAWLALGALGILGAWRVRALRPGALVLASWMLGWSAYAIAIGGDDFSAWRHHCPSLLLAGCLAAHSAGGWPRRATHAHAAIPAVEPSEQLSPRVARVHLAACALALFALPFAQLADLAQHRARGERWVWHGLEMGAFLAQAFAREQPLLAVDAAGCLPYASRLPCLDMLGLNDRHIARQPPRPGTRFRPGHMRGDVGYVLERAPDLLVFGTPPGFPLQAFDAGGSFLHEPRFRADYRLASFACGPSVPLARVWVRLEGRAGLERGESASPSQERESVAPRLVRIPAWLLASIDAERAIAAGGLSSVEHVLADPPVLGLLDARGRAAARLRAGTWVEVDGFELAPGRWRARSEPEQARLLWRIGGARLEDGASFAWSGGACSLGVLAPDESLVLNALVLERESD